jgi:hypothetical protein
MNDDYQYYYNNLGVESHLPTGIFKGFIGGLMKRTSTGCWHVSGPFIAVSEFIVLKSSHG